MKTIKEVRVEKKLTQKQVAELIGISLRTYKYYEADETKIDRIKYKYILEKLEEINKIDETHGILNSQDIESLCRPIFDKYEVEYCILFGSYAKGKAKETSDIDLLISTTTTGLQFYGMVEEIREALHKNVDVLDINQLKNNLELTKEILRDGIKIYG